MDGYVAKPIQPEELLTALEAAAGGDAVDREALLARVNGNTKLLGKLTKLFFADNPRLLAAIGKAIGKRDARAVQMAAHTLKGSVGNFDARRAYAAARQLEEMGRQGELSGAEAAYRALAREIALVEKALAAWSKS